MKHCIEVSVVVDCHSFLYYATKWLHVKPAFTATPEAAHVCPLGSPHNGSNTPNNILCLCPNHHVLFDHGGVAIDEDLSLIGAEGKLTVDPQHTLSEDHLSYRREHYQTKG